MRKQLTRSTSLAMVMILLMAFLVVPANAAPVSHPQSAKASAFLAKVPVMFMVRTNAYFSWWAGDCHPGNNPLDVCSGYETDEDDNDDSVEAHATGQCSIPFTFDNCYGELSATLSVECPSHYQIRSVRQASVNPDAIAVYVQLVVQIQNSEFFYWQTLGIAHAAMAPDGNMVDMDGGLNWDLLEEMGCWGGSVSVDPYFYD